MVPAWSLTLWIPVRGTSGPLQSWFPAVAACNPGTSCFQGSRLSQTTELRSSQQDSRGGAWPVGHASDTPLRPSLGALHRLLRPLGKTCPAPDTPFASGLAPPSTSVRVGVGRKATPPAHASASPRPSPTLASPTVPEQHGRATPPRHAPSRRSPRFRKLPELISGFGLPYNAPPAPDPYIQSLLHARMRQNLREWQEKAGWSR